MLRLENLHKSFGDITAVDGLSLEIARGKIFGLLGPNGAGKTTTVNLAVGLLQPDSGSVTLNGDRSPNEASARNLIGVAPQSLSLYEELTGRENLAFYGRLYDLSSGELKERISWTLDFVQLAERAGDRVSTYSGGMKRRLNLAVALVHDPPLLLLDEPTVGVDPQSRNAIFENILALREEGKAILYTTHYMEEAQRLCDRVGILDRGKMLALGGVGELTEAHGGKTVITVQTRRGDIKIETDDPMAELQKLQQRDDVITLRVERPNLESVFLNLTGRQLRD